MDTFAQANPSPRVIPPLRPDGRVARKTVGRDVDAMTEAAARTEPRDFLAAGTPRQVAQGLLQALPEAIGSGLVVLDAKRDAEGHRFGELTITTATKTVGISLLSLSADTKQALNRLSSGPLAQVFSWVANDTVLTVVAHRSRWMEFMRAAGREYGRVRAFSDAYTVARKAVDEGRLTLPPGTELTEDNAVAFLSYAYLGQYNGPVSADDYDRAFPGIRRPRYRRASVINNWPDSSADSPALPTLHQIQHLREEPCAVYRALFDMVRAHLPPEEQDRPSRELPRAMKKAAAIGLGLVRGPGREDGLVVDYLQDEGVLGTMAEEDMDDLERRRDNVRAFFGDNQLPLTAALDIAPGAEFRARLLRRRCSYCGERHECLEDECALGRRGAQRMIGTDEFNCAHCLGHDHRVKACPTLHFHCQHCHRLGHLTVNCGFATEKAHLDRFLANCQLGLFTRLERHGPLAGSFGFGLGLRTSMPRSTMRLVNETRLVNECRFDQATEAERAERTAAARRVVEEVPLLNLHYLPSKTPTETWHKYWSSVNLRVRGVEEVGPYRGAAAPILRVYPCEEALDEDGDRDYQVEAGRRIAEEDARCEVERVEGQRAEIDRLLEIRGAESDVSGDWTGIRLSASVISDYDEEDTNPTLERDDSASSDRTVLISSGATSPIPRGSAPSSPADNDVEVEGAVCCPRILGRGARDALYHEHVQLTQRCVVLLHRLPEGVVGRALRPGSRGGGSGGDGPGVRTRSRVRGERSKYGPKNV